MPGINRQQWEDLQREVREAREEKKAQEDRQYRMVGTSTAWQQILEFLEEEQNAVEGRIETITKNFMHEKLLSHDALLTQKSLMDIAQGQRIVLDLVQTKMQSYTQDNGGE